MKDKNKDDPIEKAFVSTERVVREWDRLNRTNEQIRKALWPTTELLKASQSLSDQIQRTDAMYSKLAQDAMRSTNGLEKAFKEMERSQLSIEKLLKPSFDLDLSKLFQQKFDLSLSFTPKFDFGKFAEATVVR
jgi:predicted transcriptional regulator